ncbi:MAG: hypothetical protein FWG52_08290 [Proteobacteria bacterium]|nr:hypothetical protein [Pseudomonadota bacterium]
MFIFHKFLAILLLVTAPDVVGGTESRSREFVDEGIYRLRVREIAQNFLNDFNEKNGTHWLAWNVEMKSLVPACTVPLQIEWVPEKSDSRDKELIVQCTKTINNVKWSVSVPVRDAGTTYSIEISRHRSDIHGLYEIRQEAQTFVADYNKKNKSHWTALDPDLRILVPKCADPLIIEWGDAGKIINGYAVRNIVATCKNITEKRHQDWNVRVPVACDLPPDSQNIQCHYNNLRQAALRPGRWLRSTCYL